MLRRELWRTRGVEAKAQNNNCPDAAARPDVLFVGLDVDGVCVMRAAERAIVQGVSNAVFVLHDDSDLSETFGEGEPETTAARCSRFKPPTPKRLWA